MLYKQTVYLPIIFQLDEGIVDKIGFFLKRNFLDFKNVAVLSGGTFSYPVAKKICEANNWKSITISEDANSLLIEELKREVNKGRFNLIIGVGGGKVIDIGKRLSFLTNVNFLAVPTIISNDGLISPISVIKNLDGFRESLPAQMPMGVVVDLDIIAGSPKKYLKAAAGDILTNVSATNDWILAYENIGEKINDIAFQMSKNAANNLIYFSNVDFNYKPFVKQIVQGQISSGIAMALAGESRPCSGSEHLISHALDFLKLTDGILHGTQVASISLFSLYLQNKLIEEILEYAINVDIPLQFHQLGVGIIDNLPVIYQASQKMRPGRFTVLDTLTEREFTEKYNEYCRFVKSYLKQTEKKVVSTSR
jgi:glycerol-1-phosphate dehydrogenase [NAD(P)+]